jgi:hypothetical protein
MGGTGNENELNILDFVSSYGINLQSGNIGKYYKINPEAPLSARKEI